MMENLRINDNKVYDVEEFTEILFYNITDLKNGYFIGETYSSSYLFDNNGKVLEKAKVIKQSGDYIAIINKNKIILKNTKLELIGLFPDEFIDPVYYIYFGNYHVIVTYKTIFVYNFDLSMIKLKYKNYGRVRNSNLVLLSSNRYYATLINQKLKIKRIKFNLAQHIIDIVDRYIIIVSDIIDVFIYDDDLKLIYYDNLRENFPKVNLNSFWIKNGGLYTHILNDNQDATITTGIKINLPSLKHLF